LEPKAPKPYWKGTDRGQSIPIAFYLINITPVWRAPAGFFGNGTKGFPLGLNSIMERLTAYLVSAGIIAFGIWIVATAELWWGSLMFWRVVGMAPIAVGMASLVNEIHNDRQV
jgi:hypothetical protein